MLVTYFANDLSDPAVARRVRMLRIGGADVKLLGFRRSASPVYDVDGIAAVDLGRTCRRSTWRSLLRKCCDVLWKRVKPRDMVSGADVVLARNLEMVTIAEAARIMGWVCDVRLAYECLDIHKALLGNGLSVKALTQLGQKSTAQVALH